jgi:hypothetical protein
VIDNPLKQAFVECQASSISRVWLNAAATSRSYDPYRGCALLYGRANDLPCKTGNDVLVGSTGTMP